MSKNVAVLDNQNIVIAINIHSDEYVLQENEVLVSNPAYVGGDYFENYFYPPQPFSSWSRDGQGNWEAPKPYPDQNLDYLWDEEAGDWVAIVFQQEN